jgi:hypothetical protein
MTDTSPKHDYRDTWEKIYDMCVEIQGKFPDYFNKPTSEPLWKYIWGNPTMFFHYTTIESYPGVLRNDWVFMDNQIKGLPTLPDNIKEELYAWISGRETLGIKVFSKTYQ